MPPGILQNLIHFGGTVPVTRNVGGKTITSNIPQPWAIALGKGNAQVTKQQQGQTASLPGNGGVMPGTPTVNPGGFAQPTPLGFGTVPGTTINLGGFGGPLSGGTTFASGITPGQVGQAIIGTGACNHLPSPFKEICAGVSTVIGSPKPTPTPSTNGSTTAVVPATCPPGTVKVGNTCVSPGDVFPGGAPLFTEAGGQAVVGAFGLPALSPTIVGSVAGRNGVSPIRRCPRGMVLGFDELCYPKAVLPRRSRFRKHKGAVRPPMTGADAAALRRIGSLKNRVRELANDAGMTCANRGSRSKKSK